MKPFRHLFALVGIEHAHRNYFGNPEMANRCLDISPHHCIRHQRRYVARCRRKPDKRAVTHTVRGQLEQSSKLELTDKYRLSELIIRGHSRMKTTKPRYLVPVFVKHPRLSRMEVFYTGSFNCKA